MDIAALGIKIDSSGAVKATDDLNRLTAAAGKAEGSTSNASKAFTEMDRATQRSAASVANLAMSVSRLGSMIGAALSVREILRAAESWTGLQNRLRLVTESTAQLGKATDDVYKIAQRTSSSLDSTSQVYQKFAQNADALGLSMGKVAQLTDTVSKAVAISGSSAQAADAALMQFGQALGSGVLRGEEFNSIIEQAPGLMQALADGLGVPIGAMRQLAADGKLTGDVIVDALTRAADSVDQKFGTRIKTVSQATTELSNAFTRFVGQVDSSTGATATLANTISAMAENMDGMARAASVLALATIPALTKAMFGLAGAVMAIPGMQLVKIIGLAAGAFVAFSAEASTISHVMNTVGAVFETASDLIDAAFGDVFTVAKGFFDLIEFDGASIAEGFGNAFRTAFLLTAQFLDGLYAHITGGFAAVNAAANALTDNIKNFFTNAFNRAREIASEALAGIAQKINDVFGTDIEVSMWVGPGDAAIRSITDAAKEAYEQGSKTLGIYNALINRLTMNDIDDAFDVSLIDDHTAALAKNTPKITENTKAKDAAAKAAKAFEDERARSLQAQYEEIAKLDEQATALEQQALYFGYSEQALNALTIARLRDQQAALAGYEGAEEQVAILERQIDAYQRMGMAMGDIATKEQQKADWEAWSQDVGRIFDQVGQKLTDALFDGGKSGRELVKDLFKTLTLKVLVQPVMGALQGAATNILGGALGIGGGESGGLSGLLSGANSLSSLYGAFTGGVTSTLASGISALGSAFGSSAITSFAAGMKGATLGAGLAGPTTLGAGGAMGAGAAVAAALPWVTGGLAVASLAQKAFGLGSKEKTGEGFAGWIKGSRGGQDVLTYETASRSGGWLRSGANYLDFRAGDPAVQAGISDLVAQTSSSLKAYADALALNTMDIQEYAKHIFIPTMDRSAEEIQQNILSEVNLYAQELTRDFWPALQEVRRGGEELTDTLARVATAVQSVNPVLDMLGIKAFEVSLQGGELASRLSDMFGGMEGFGAATGAYYDAFYSEQEKFDNALGALSAALQGVGLTLPDVTAGADESKAAYRALVEAQDLTSEAGQRAFTVLVQSAGAFDGLTQAAQQLGAAVEDTSAVLREREGLERQWLALNGETAQLRQRDLALLDESNRALQEQIWALQDFDEAAQATRTSLQAMTDAQRAYDAQIRAYQDRADTMLGNTEAIRQRELATLSKSAQEWQLYIWAIEDAQAANARAQEQYRQDLAAWQKLQDNVQTAWRELNRVVEEEINRLRDTARQTDDAMAALTQRVSAHSDLINTQINGLETLLGTMRGVFDYIGEQVRDLRGISGSRGMYAQQGRDFIAQALAGGGVPDLGKLTEAVSAIRDEMAVTEYGSAFERDYAANVLANQLQALQDQTEPQISVAEQQLKIAQDQLAELQEMVRKAQATIDETRGVKDNTGDLKVSWDAYTDALATTLDQSASFNAVISAIESGNMLSQAAWAEQLNKWDTSLGSAQKQYDALKALVDAGLVTDAGTQAQIDALGALLTEAQKQVGVLEGVDLNTGSSGTAGEQVKKLADLFEKAKDQISGLGAVESKTGYTKELFDKVISAARQEEIANAQISKLQEQITALAPLAGIKTNTGLMVDALNNFLRSVGEAAVAEPDKGTGTGTGTGTGITITPPPTIPDSIFAANHGYTREQVLGKRHYKPTTTQEGADYVNFQPDLLAFFRTRVAAGEYRDTDNDRFRFALAHWQDYVVPNKSGVEHTRRYATGGNHSGGLRLVGEMGPELEVTGPSRVFNHMKTQDILRNAMTGRGTIGPEMATLTRHAEQMIRTMETMGRATVQQLHRIARQLERWDTDGMPETRDMVAA